MWLKYVDPEEAVEAGKSASLLQQQRPNVFTMDVANILPGDRIDIELVYTEILASGLQDRLAGGIVITGGGAELQHAKQLFEYITSMDTRVGYPNEHLGKSKVPHIKSLQVPSLRSLRTWGF